MLQIIHFSDLHFKESNNTLKSRVEIIKNAIESERLPKEKTIIIVTGDIAFSGKVNEYMEAMDFFQSLIDLLGENVDLFFVPGNHDNEFDSSKTKVRETLIDSFSTEKIDDYSLNIICESQTNFNNFKQLFHKNVEEKNAFYSFAKIEVGGYSIALNLINTACFSTINEKQGKLKVPLTELSLSTSEDFVISMFHHNFNWLESNNAREVKSKIEKESDIIFTGHEHTYSHEKREKSDSAVEHFEGSVLQDSANFENSSFNIYRIDFNSKKISSAVAIFQKGIYIIKSKEEIIYKKNKRFLGNTYTLKDEFKIFLNEAGVEFQHPQKEKILLEDVYVYPQFLKLETSGSDGGKNTDDYYISSSFLKDLKKENENKFLIIGEEKSGKTSLGKMLYKEFLDKNFIPIYLDGMKIKNCNLDKIDTEIKKAFETQYEKSDWECFYVLEKKNKFLIIDNFDQFYERNLKKKEIIEFLENKFSNIIILGQGLLEIEVMVPKISNMKNYQKFRIIEFGHHLRYCLIKKWNTLGSENEDKEIQRKIQEAERILTFSIGKNLVPSFPIFILTSLQMIESGNSTNLEHSTQGYYYQYLITEAILKYIRKNDEINSFFNYLGEIAFEMYNKNQFKGLYKQEWEEFHRHFLIRYAISKNFNSLYFFDTFIKTLISCGIIVCDDVSEIRFKYKYIYYYFLSKFLSEKIEKPEITETVKKLLKNIYTEEAANIVMFLTHHNNKITFITNGLIENCKKIFNEHNPIKLNNDIVEINKLVDKLPIFSAPDMNVENNITEEYKEKDRIERSISNNLKKDTTVHEDYELEEFMEWARNLNIALKSIEIIGNLLKNYHSVLEAQTKIELIQETYNVSLKMTKFFFELATEDLEGLTNRIEEFLIKKEEKQKTKQKEIARQIIFNLLALISYSFFEKTSSALGYDKLSMTYDTVLEKNMDNNGVQLIDLMIRIFYFEETPFQKIDKLKKEFIKNNFADYILKSIIYRYLYLNKTEYNVRQRLCDMVSITNNVQFIK